MLRDCNAQCNISCEIREGKPLRFNDALDNEMKNYSIAQQGFNKVSMAPYKTLDAMVLVDPSKVDVHVGDF